MTGPLVYGSVCSGIESATAAWHPLGWKPAFFSEIDAFPRAVLQHHYSDVPCHGDFTTIQEHDYDPIDLLVGGTPCQSFSVAGLRKGFADERGNLTLEFIRLAQRLRPKWLVWENVPGVLSIDRGRAFGSFLGGLAECGYGFAYRVLDAQHFGVPQRRRRVFVVGYFGDWRPAAAVLFESESLLRDLTPSRETGERLAPTISARTKGGGGLGTDFDLDGGLIRWPVDVAPTLDAHYGDKMGLEDQHIRGGAACSSLPEVAMCLNAGAMGRQDAESETLIPTNGGCFDVAHSLRAEGFDASEDGTGRGTPLVPVPHVQIMPTLRAAASQDGPGHGARSGDSKDEYIVPMTLAIRGREEESRFEFRQDGLANAILTPNGGRAGIGVGAVAIPINTQLGLRGGDTSNTTREGIGIGDEGDPAFTLQSAHSHAVAFAQNCRGEVRDMDISSALSTGGGKPGEGYPAVRQGMQVRRLTPRECERLQGFPDDYTLIPNRGKPAADGPRYKALGNSMAVPCMRWLGERIQLIDDLQKEIPA